MSSNLSVRPLSKVAPSAGDRSIGIVLAGGDVVVVGGGVVVVCRVVSDPSDNNAKPIIIPVIASTAITPPTRSHLRGIWGGLGADGEAGSSSATNLVPQLPQKLASGGLF